MKLVKQTILEYRQGKSDKVYEVDLCQVGDDQYVVNFRYGRRGSKLREGSKTPMPVALAKAEQTFAKLVADKVKKGYQDQGDSSSEGASAKAVSEPSVPAASRASTGGLGPRENAILERLRLGNRGGQMAGDDSRHLEVVVDERRAASRLVEELQRAVPVIPA